MSVVRLPITIDAARGMLAYSRESNERLLGIFGQDAEIEAWTESEGYEVIGFAHDLEVHGQSPVDERPGLVAAIAAVESGEAAGIIVHRLDRVGRDFRSQDDAVRRVWKAGGRLFSTDYGEWKPDRPGDPQWHLRTKYAAMAEAEYYALLARLQTARREKMARGGYGGGPRLGRRYGSELVDDFPSPGRRDYRPVPEEQAVIRRVVAACPNGRGYSEMARVLNAEGVPTVKGARWTPKTVRDLALRGPARILELREAVPEVKTLVWKREWRSTA